METYTINSALITHLNFYKNTLTNYSDNEFNQKQALEIWSLGQMYEHLVASGNFFFLKNIKYCLEKKNGQIGGEKNEIGENIFKYNSFPPIKVKVPGNTADPVAQSKENYESIIDKIIQQLNSQIDIIDKDIGEYKTNHVVFGWLNAKEWLQAFEIHHRHHLRQKSELEDFFSAKNAALTTVMDGLMRRYSERVPDVKIITKALVSQGVIASENDIENDHVAFRTMGIENLGIASFEKIFLYYGYQKRDYFFFEGKKLNAFWFSPPEAHFPRIFVSELRVNDLSETAQKIIKKYTDSVKTDPSDCLDLNNGEEVDQFLHSPLWPLPTLEEYKTLLVESEYAAWVIYNRYYLNHYTVSVHNLPEGYNTIEQFDDFVESLGVKLTDAGGRIKTSPDGVLLQSSTVAQMVEATFSGGEKYSIAGSYVEFAERKVLPQFAHLPKSEIKREHRRDGFETGNADKIFESTFISQTQKAQ